eukprot:s313_g22.t1
MERALRRLWQGGSRSRNRNFSSRLPPFCPSGTMSTEQRELYDRVLEDRGKTGAKGGFSVTNSDGSLVGPWNAMVCSPLIGGLAERMGSFCRHQNACAPDLYEIGILVVGVQWLSQFEWYAHEKLALKAGVSPKAIQAVKDQVAPEVANGMTEQQRAVYKYARELHETKRVSDQTHSAALTAVGGERALVDLVFTMGFYHQISMTLNAFNVPLPEGVTPPFKEPKASALGVLVTCLDADSLANCRASNVEPGLCVDARAWPKSPMSKILTVAMCVRHGFDVLWLDTDTVVLNDPIPREQKVPQDREMLFSVEADSVNCVNTGAYFMRSSPKTQRYLGHWASLYFGRPVGALREARKPLPHSLGPCPKGPLPLGHPYLHLYSFCIKVAFRTNVAQPLDRDGTSAGRGGCDAWLRLLAGDADRTSDTCRVGQCLPEEVGAQVAGDDQASPAIGLMQTFLKYRLREERRSVSAQPEGLPSVNMTFPGLQLRGGIRHQQNATDPVFCGKSSVDPLNPYRLRMVAGACPLSKDLGVEVPLSIGSIAKLQAFQAIGFIQALPHCGLTTLNSVTELIAQGENVYQKNRLAKNLAVAWAVIALGLMIWSFLSVAVVPRKGTTPAVKAGLADDRQAYTRGLLHYISLGWVDELVGRYGKCSHAVIDDNEIISNRRDDNFEPYVKFKHYWEEEVKKAGSIEKAWITRALYKTVGFKGCSVLVTLAVVEQFSGSIFMVWGLNLFLSSLEDLDTFRKLHPEEEVDYLTPTIMILTFIWGSPMLFRATSIILTLVEGHYTQICASGLASVVFDKALRTPAGSVKTEQQKDAVDDEEPDPMGQHKPNLVQILNVDIVDTWGGLLADVLSTVTAPFIAIGLLVMMIHQIGDSSATVGACYVLPVLFLTVLATTVAMKFWRVYQVWLDKRMKWLTETLISIRTIKALAWERLSYDKLSQAREGEITQAKYILAITGFMTALQHTVPWGVLLITVWFAERQGSIPAHRIMILQRLIGALLGNVSQVTNGITRLMTVPNSFNRIKRFLAQPDRPKDVVRPPALQTPNAPALRVTGSFTFGGKKPALKHLDVAIPKGELVGVIGRVGSGKTTFLQTIIGELYPLEHSFVEAPDTVSGHVAYCSQVPWIFEGTLRENIITKSAMHQERYYSCIYAAGLAPDLQILPGGDQVTIGSFGIRLSGGQRARVALARAAYMEAASLVLMDDPFAAVDGPTGNHIFNELILGSPLRGRTRIVVTQPEKSRLQHFDRLLLFEDGCIVEMGPPAEVMESEAFRRIESQVEETAPAGDLAVSGNVGRVEDAMTMVKQANEAGSLLREEEVREDITWRTVWWWIRTAGWVNLFVLISSVFLQSIVEMRESLVLAVWIDAKVAYPDAGDGVFMTRMIVVVLCCCASICICFLAVSTTTLGAARSIHNQVMSSLLKAPVDRFFDKQPVGRLINRLSFDMKQVDETFVNTIFGMGSMLATMLTTNLFILWVMPRSVAFLSFPIYAITFYFVYLYRGIAVPLVFHSKHSLSSVQDLQAVVISQCISIRSNGMMDSFMVRYNHYSQSVIRSQYLIYYVCRAWAQSRVFLCFGILAAYFAFGGLYSGVSMGILATCVSFAFFQMNQFESLCMVFTHLLNVLNALQRLSRYVGLPEEAADDMPNDFSVLKRAKIRRGELVPLQMRAEAVLRSGIPSQY